MWVRGKSSSMCRLVFMAPATHENEKNMKKAIKKKTKKKPETYTTGDLNKLIDSLCHPLIKTNEGFLLVDGLLHGLVEQNPPKSIRKFVKYSLPKIIGRLKKADREK